MDWKKNIRGKRFANVRVRVWVCVHLCERYICLALGKIIGIGSEWPNFINALCHWKRDFSLKFYNPFNSIVKFLSFYYVPYHTHTYASFAVPAFAMTWCWCWFLSQNFQRIQKMPSISLQFFSTHLSMYPHDVPIDNVSDHFSYIICLEFSSGCIQTIQPNPIPFNIRPCKNEQQFNIYVCLSVYWVWCVCQYSVAIYGFSILKLCNHKQARSHVQSHKIYMIRFVQNEWHFYGVKSFVCR